MVANTPMATITTVSMATPASRAAAGSNSFDRKESVAGSSDCASSIADAGSSVEESNQEFQSDRATSSPRRVKILPYLIIFLQDNSTISTLV